jgi:hypothetical protein
MAVKREILPNVIPYVELQKSRYFGAYLMDRGHHLIANV